MSKNLLITVCIVHQESLGHSLDLSRVKQTSVEMTGGLS